jgi:hypothetical protein
MCKQAHSCVLCTVFYLWLLSISLKFVLRLCETLYMHSFVYTHRLDSHESLLESFVSDCAYVQVQTQFHAIFKA